MSPRRSSPKKPEKQKESSSEEEEHEVERIVDSRVQRGRVQYLVKWLGYADSDNTWQEESTMNCPELIARFKSEQSLVKKASPKRRETNTGSSSPRKRPRSPNVKDTKPISPPPSSSSTDWERDVANVMTVTKEGSQLFAHLKWKSDLLTVEPVKVANVRCPQKMLAFYESRLRFPEERKTEP